MHVLNLVIFPRFPLKIDRNIYCKENDGIPNFFLLLLQNKDQAVPIQPWKMGRMCMWKGKLGYRRSSKTWTPTGTKHSKGPRHEEEKKELIVKEAGEGNPNKVETRTLKLLSKLLMVIHISTGTNVNHTPESSLNLLWNMKFVSLIYCTKTRAQPREAHARDSWYFTREYGVLNT